MGAQQIYSSLLGYNVFRAELRYSPAWRDLEVCLVIEIDIDSHESICYSIKGNTLSEVPLNNSFVQYIIDNSDALINNAPINESNCDDVGLCWFTFNYECSTKRIFLEQPEAARNKLYSTLYDFIEQYIETLDFIEICSKYLS